jgi:hypothetical protein
MGFGGWILGIGGREGKGGLMRRERIAVQNRELIDNNPKLLLDYEPREEIPKKGILNGHTQGQRRKRPKFRSCRTPF